MTELSIPSITLYFFQSDGKDAFAIKRAIILKDKSLLEDVLQILVKETYGDIEIQVAR